MPEVLSKTKIRLELVPWVADTCGYKGPGHLILEEQVEGGATIGILLRKIAAEHKALKRLCLT
jgi:hypothetical protein